MTELTRALVRKTVLWALGLSPEHLDDLRIFLIKREPTSGPPAGFSTWIP